MEKKRSIGKKDIARYILLHSKPLGVKTLKDAENLTTIFFDSLKHYVLTEDVSVQISHFGTFKKHFRDGNYKINPLPTSENIYMAKPKMLIKLESKNFLDDSNDSN